MSSLLLTNSQQRTKERNGLRDNECENGYPEAKQSPPRNSLSRLDVLMLSSFEDLQMNETCDQVGIDGATDEDDQLWRFRGVRASHQPPHFQSPFDSQKPLRTRLSGSSHLQSVKQGSVPPAQRIRISEIQSTCR